jgi:hypothetical protein
MDKGVCLGRHQRTCSNVRCVDVDCGALWRHLSHNAMPPYTIQALRELRCVIVDPRVREMRVEDGVE